MREKIYLTVLFLLLAGFGCSYFLSPQEYSQEENRYLTTFPQFSAEGILSGTWQEKVEEAASDQVLLRDEFVRMTVGTKRLMGKCDSGGVYFGKDGYYREKTLDSRLSLEQYEKNLRIVAQMLEELDASVQPVVCMIPSSGVVLSELLPAQAGIYSSDWYYEKGSEVVESSWLDLRQELIQAKEQYDSRLYFRTDHHWTAQGAYEASTRIGSTFGFTIADLKEYGLVEAEEPFYGTLYSKAPLLGTKADCFTYPDTLPACTVTIDQDETTDSIYRKEYLQQKDKYAAYFGGNYGIVRIQMEPDTDNAGGKLLLIKDSFANSLVPYLMPYYEEIIMVDLRYYNDSFVRLVEEEKPQDLLILYEMTNFAKENHIFKLLR